MKRKKTLVEELTDEILRVKKIIEIYETIPRSQMATALMKFSIKKVYQAVVKEDTQKMTEQLKILQTYEI